FAVEDARGATKCHLVLFDGADFDHRTTGGEVAEENAERAALRVGLRDGPNTSLVEIPHLRDVLAHRLSGDGERVEPQCSRFPRDRKSTRLNSSHLGISYAVFCLKKKKHKM